MGKNNNFIEINGKRYDSHSGKVLPRAELVPKPVALAASPIKHPPLTKTKSAVPSRARQPAKHMSAHRPTPAHTLMRHAVKRPSTSQHIRANGPTDELARQPLGNVVVSKSVQSLDHKRLQKATQVSKSQLIKHFSAVTTSDFMAAAVPSATTIMPATRNIGSSLPSATTVSKPKTTTDLLEHALRQATSHQQKPPKSARSERAKHHVAVAAAVMLPLLLLAIVASQNASGIRLQMASARIGFSAKLPDYQPAGFSQGQLNYSPGVVAAHFHSNSDERAYTLIQQRSNWDNQTLSNHFVAPADPNYQTVEAGGRTIYLYGTQNATWLNHGIWYIVQANGSLSDRQLVQLATSL